MPKFMDDAIVETITNDDVKRWYEVVGSYWNKHLKELGVKKPPKWGSNGAACLGVAAYNYPDTFIVSKEQYVAILGRLGYKSNDYQSMRHLGLQNGYCLLNSSRLKEIVPDTKNGHYWLKSLDVKYPDFDPNRRKGFGLGTKSDGRCCYCQHREGDENPWFGGINGPVTIKGAIATVRQKAHTALGE